MKSHGKLIVAKLLLALDLRHTVFFFFKKRCRQFLYRVKWQKGASTICICI